MSFTMERALAAEPKILANGMKSFDHFRRLAGNPKLKEIFVDAVELALLLPDLPLAGDSALDKLTMLADNSYKTYAVSLARWSAIGGLRYDIERENPLSLKQGNKSSLVLIEVWVEEPPVVQDMYGNTVVEPLHLALTYTDEKLEFDERVSSELGRLLEGLCYEFENRWC